MVDLSKMTKWDMGKLFDFSVLPKQSTEADIRRGCQIAKEYNCKAFCFSSSEWTPICSRRVKGNRYHGRSSDRIPIWPAVKCS